jgi:hypothetical protein
MSFQLTKYVGVLAVVALALPVWAKSSSHTDSTTFEPEQSATIGQTQLKPGQYTLKATESGNQLEILQHGTVIATVPCTWVELGQKPRYSEVFSDKDRVTQVEFQGRMEAVKVG